MDLKSGKTLYAYDEGRFFLPASNLKLFTTGLALLKLGADYKFQTRVIEEASGDLTLVGSGDPSLSGRQYPYRPGVPEGPPLRAIDDLAQQAVNAGLTHVHGNIVGDDRLYPWEPLAIRRSQATITICLVQAASCVWRAMIQTAC